MHINHIRSKSDGDGATDLLRAQHREIEQLLDALRVSLGRDKERLLAEVGDLIAVHLAIEERVFYPGLGSDVGGGSPDARLELKRLAAELLETELDGSSFDTAVSSLRERFGAHARAEERLFSNVRQRLPRARIRRLAYDMRVLEFQLRTDAPLRELILSPSKRTANA
jgi:Hemerythrin HHE cation binding domain